MLIKNQIATLNPIFHLWRNWLLPISLSIDKSSKLEWLVLSARGPRTNRSEGNIIDLNQIDWNTLEADRTLGYHKPIIPILLSRPGFHNKNPSNLVPIEIFSCLISNSTRKVKWNLQIILNYELSKIYSDLCLNLYPVLWIRKGIQWMDKTKMPEFRMCVRREMTCYHLRRSLLYVFNLEFDIHLVQFSLNLTLKKCRTSFCVI